MRKTILIIMCMMMPIVLTAAPVQAFSSKLLDIEILNNGDAIITFDYEMTWYEDLAISARLVDMNTDIGNAIKSNFGENAEILELTKTRAKIKAPDYAIVRPYSDGSTEYESPSLSFEKAQESLNKYWFASYLTVDFSPETIIVRFPDNYEQKFYDQIWIPAVSNKQGIR